MERSAGLLDEIGQEIAACQRCELHRTRTNTVPGAGSAEARIVILGEAPGAKEDAQGKPFVGASGKVLSRLLEEVGLSRERDCWVGNTLKCRPPNNRDPKPEEIRTCRPFLIRQLEVIRPRVVVTLGRFAMAHYLPEAKITQVHGEFRQVEGLVVFPVYHPSAALRSTGRMQELRADFQKLAEALPGLG